MGLSWDCEAHVSVPRHREGCKSQLKANSSLITLLRSVSLKPDKLQSAGADPRLKTPLWTIVGEDTGAALLS